MNAESFWHAVARRLEAGTPVWVALVVANTRGSPGTRGARMLVDAVGDVEGTIGGGVMEANLIDEARHRLRAREDRPPELRRLVHRKTGTHNPSGLICAGEQTNLALTLDPERDAATVRLFCDTLEDQAGRSARLRIDANGLSVATEHASSPTLGYARLNEEGGEWRYAESSVNPRRLAIVGGGHCGRALARLAVDVGFWVDVFDTRAELLRGPGWPEAARRHVLGEYDELARTLQRPSLATVVVMTTAVYHDIEALAALAPNDLRWLGVMGSRAKIRVIRQALRHRGFSDGCIDAIHGPIGLKMKSDTPAEIAVSIMGQLLSET